MKLYGYKRGSIQGIIRLTGERDFVNRQLAVWYKIGNASVYSKREPFPVLERWFIDLHEPNELLKEIL